MANQPGYQAPGQSNATGSGNQNYQQNTIEGMGYSAPSMFGSPGGGAPQGPSGQSGQLLASNAAQSLFNTQFQPSTPKTPSPMPQMGQAPQGQQMMSGSGPSEFGTKQGALSTQPPPSSTSSGSTAFGGKSVENVTPVTNEGSPGYMITYRDGTTETVYQLSPDGPSRYNELDMFVRSGNVPRPFDYATPYQSDYTMQRLQMEAQDPTLALQRQLAADLATMDRERGQATRQAAIRQRGLGFSGAGGLDIQGIGADFATAAGQLNLSGQQAIEDAQAAYDRELLALRQTEKADIDAVKQGNYNVAQNEIDALNLGADNMAAQGLFVGVNPNLIGELEQLRALSLTEAIEPAEYALLVSNVVAKYGDSKYVGEDQIKAGVFTG